MTPTESQTFKKSKPMFEKVTDTLAGVVIASQLSESTNKQIKEAERLHKRGRCPHNIIVDEYGYLYDFRSCYTCGKGLGTV